MSDSQAQSLPANQEAVPPARRGSSVARSAGLITLGNALSRVLGLVRESAIASLFGKTMETSAFSTAATVPTMLYDLVIGGAVSAALIPTFSEYATKDERTGRSECGQIAGTMGVIALVATALTACLLFIAAPALVSFLGVTASGPAREMTISLVRVVLPSVVFLGLSGVVTALLYARQQVAFPAFAVACYNAGIIAAGVLLAPRLGVASLVVGVLAGSALQFGLQVVGLRQARVRLGINFRHPAVRQMLILYAPVAFGLVVSQIGVIVDRNLAWRIGEDSVAVMRFATTLIQLPLGLVATATSFAVLPALSRFALSRTDGESFGRTLDQGMRLGILAIVPAAAAILILPEPLIRLLFERQAFDAEATRVTAQTLLYYAPQLPFVAVDQLLVFAFYARKNTVTPAVIGLGGVGIYLVSGIALSGPAGLGVGGLALANTLQNSLHAVILFGLLWRETGSLLRFGIGRVVLKSLAAAIPLALVLMVVAPVAQAVAGTLPLLAVLTAGGAVSGAVYVVGLRVLRVEEIGAARDLLQRRLGSRLRQVGRGGAAEE